MAPYLATVQIGRYQLLEIDAVVPLYAAVPGALVPEYDAAFGLQPEMLKAFTRLFGDYPFAGYTVVVTEDELEIPLESQGLSTFGANFLTTEWHAERLIAHELSHQWFGNSLTVAHWRDIWLHEGSPATASGSGPRSPARSRRTSARWSTGVVSTTRTRTWCSATPGRS